MTELSSYVFSTLREGELSLSRGSGDGLDPILLVAPVVELPPLESLKRLEHEYADEGAAWFGTDLKLAVLLHSGRYQRPKRLTRWPAAVAQREGAPAPGAFLGEGNPVRRQERRHSKESRMSLTSHGQGPLV